MDAEGEGVTYRWQCTQEGEAQWMDMDGDSASVDVTVDEDSPRKYIRCVITDQYGNSVESDTVILLLSRLTVTKQPRGFVDIFLRGGNTMETKTVCMRQLPKIRKKAFL